LCLRFLRVLKQEFVLVGLTRPSKSRVFSVLSLSVASVNSFTVIAPFLSIARSAFLAALLTRVVGINIIH